VSAGDALVDAIAAAVADRLDRTPEWPAVLTVDQAAAMCQVHPGTVRREAAAGTLPGRKVGKEWRFARDEVLAWLGGAPVGLQAVPA
jgi:excisionase family DNA binding protein